MSIFLYFEQKLLTSKKKHTRNMNFAEVRGKLFIFVDVIVV